MDKGDFSKGKVGSSVLRLSLPILLAEMVQILYNLVDRMFIGHIEGCGTQALTGIGVIFPLISLVGAFTNLCSYGGTSLCSISRGEKEDSKAQTIMETTFTLLVIYGLAFTALVYILQKPLFYALGADDESFFYAKQYADWYFAGTVFTMLATGMNGFANLQGHPTVGMRTVIIGAGLNIILDPVCIFVLGWGVRGAAIATFVSQLASAVSLLLFLTSSKPALRLAKPRLDKTSSKNIHKLGVSGFAFKATNSITQAVGNATLRLFGGANGSLYIAAMSVANQLREIAGLPISAVAEGAKPVMGYNYGAKEYKRTEQTIWFILKACLGINLLIWYLLVFRSETFIRIFSDDPALIDLGGRCLPLYFMAFFMMTFQMTGQNAFVALNKPKYAVFFAVLRKLLLILPFTLILPRIGMGAEGVFLAEAVSQVIGPVACFTTMCATILKPLRSKQNQTSQP